MWPSPGDSLVHGGPLDGIRVIEIGEFIAAPFAAMMLGDLGADVIKVERLPGGDPYRGFGHGPDGCSVAFANCNRNKRSLVLDLKSPEGSEALRTLAAEADVLVTSVRPPALARLGLTDEVLERLNQSLIRTYVTGFGEAGPRSEDPAFDGLIQAISGLAYLQGQGGRPELLRTFIADKVTASMTASSVMAALVARPRRGGTRISTSLLDAMAYFNFPDLFTRRTIAGAEGPDIDPVSQSVRPIRARDGWLLVVPFSGSQIRRACEAVGHPEFRDLLRAETDKGLLASALMDLLESATEQETVELSLDRFAAHDVPAARVMSLDEHLGDPQVAANATYGWFAHPSLGELRDVRFPAWFGDSRDRRATSRPAPALGQHTEEILAALAGH